MRLETKHFRARGRIALSGVGLRPRGPGGGSKRTSFRGLAGLNADRAAKSRKVRRIDVDSIGQAIGTIVFLLDDELSRAQSTGKSGGAVPSRAAPPI